MSGRSRRAAAAKRRRRMWKADPTCKRCGHRTNPDGLFSEHPKLLRSGDGTESIICRGCVPPKG